jgi:hypothetical protein
MPRSSSEQHRPTVEVRRAATVTNRHGRPSPHRWRAPHQGLLDSPGRASIRPPRIRSSRKDNSGIHRSRRTRSSPGDVKLAGPTVHHHRRGGFPTEMGPLAHNPRLMSSPLVVRCRPVSRRPPPSGGAAATNSRRWTTLVVSLPENCDRTWSWSLSPKNPRITRPLNGGLFGGRPTAILVPYPTGPTGFHPLARYGSGFQSIWDQSPEPPQCDHIGLPS